MVVFQYDCIRLFVGVLRRMIEFGHRKWCLFFPKALTTGGPRKGYSPCSLFAQKLIDIENGKHHHKIGQICDPVTPSTWKGVGGGLQPPHMTVGGEYIHKSYRFSCFHIAYHVNL